MLTAPPPPSLAFRLVHFVRPRFPYLMLAILIGEFFFTFALVFTFPPGALLMVFLGFLTLGFGVIGNGLIGSLDDALVRSRTRQLEGKGFQVPDEEVVP
jgi:hypothetical protein